MNSSELVQWVVVRVKDELEIVDKKDRILFLKGLRDNPIGIKHQISNCTQYWIEQATAETKQTVTVIDIKSFEGKVYRELKHTLAEQIKELST